MKKSRYIDSQMLSTLKEAEAGGLVPERCREHEMSSASSCKWQSSTEMWARQ